MNPIPRTPVSARVVCSFLVAIVMMLLGAVGAFAQDATATPAQQSAVVIVNALNIRSGPGTNYAKVALAHSGDVLAITGKNGDCSWIAVTTEGGDEGWVSANARFVTIDGSCNDMVIAATPAATTATPVVTPAATVAATPAATPTPMTSAATATPDPEVADNGVPDGKGCVDFGNWAGPDVIISGSLRDTNEVFDIVIKNKTVERVCLTPGRWGVTISAIANFWRDLVLDIEVHAGEVIDFPLVRA